MKERDIKMSNKQNRQNTEWVAFNNKGFSGYYKVENGELIGCPMMKDGSMDEEESYAVEYLVSGEKEMKFLETINERLGSDFEYSEFIIA